MRLDDYPALPPEERAAIDHALAGRPDLADTLAHAQRLAALVDAATAAPDAAMRAASRRLGLDRSVDDSEEAAGLNARLDALEAGAEDPVARFERLAGRPLTPAPVRPLPFVDRPAARPARPRWRRASTWARAAGVVLVAYGALFVVSASTIPHRAQVAALGEITVENPALRGTEGLPDAERLVAAAQAVRDARRSTLGLFPTYDAAALDAAAADLADLADAADRRTWISQEARLDLARVLLYRERDDEAARVLGGLVEQGGYRAPLARRLLDVVRSDG